VLGETERCLIMIPSVTYYLKYYVDDSDHVQDDI
jgi:hypothetical protein